MKEKLLIGLVFITSISVGQINTLQTYKYRGVYSYGNDIEKGRVGTIIIYAETDSTILFYFDLNRGAPSYNMGTLYGRVKINNDKGVFNIVLPYQSGGCKMTFKFTNDLLTIDEIDGFNECGFGHAVFADGEYQKQKGKFQDYFTDSEGTKYFFKKTSPEEFYKDY
jgi:hypothetical protein